jgi:replicative DNA helicase
MPEKFDFASEFTDPALERSLVAALATRPEVFWEVMAFLPEDAFTVARREYQEVAAAFMDGKIRPAIDAEPTPDPMAAARTLADLYKKRLLAGLCQSLANSLRDGTPAGDLISQMEEELNRVSAAVREPRAGQAVSFKELLPAILKEAEARHAAVEEGKPVGLPMGIKRADRALGGLQAGVHLLGGGPGEGKTCLCSQVAGHVSRCGYPVIFVSFEESLPRLGLKALCQAAEIDPKPFADGYGDLAKLKEAALQHGPDLANLSWVEGTSRLEVGRLRALALQAMNRVKADKCLVVVDYLQRMAASRREFADYRHVVSALVTELRELALRLDSPVLVISSQNRPGQGTANLTSLKESGDLEYSADTAVFLVEDEGRTTTPPARAMNLEVSKNRYGATGVVKLIFKPDIGLFRELESRE